MGRSVLSKVVVKSQISEADEIAPSLVGKEFIAPTSASAISKVSSTEPVSANKRQRTSKVLSAFTLSLVAFAAINAGLAYSPYSQINPEITSYHSWTWWTVNDIRHATKPANVVLLGSSLMVAAIAECDANHLKHSLDLATYRGASYLDTVLHDQLGGTFNTMNLSAPGQMPSDAYLTLKAALKEGMKPKVIVYGVAPRDFLDGTMQSPSDTEAFKYLRRCVDISDCGFDYFSSPFGKLDWFLQRSVNLYRLSLDCRLTLEKLSRQYLSHNGLVNLPEQEGAAGPFAIRLRALLRPFNIEPGTFLALQTVNDKSPMLDNRRDYMDRYRNPDQRLYETQFRFLDRIVNTCKQENIELVLVQMPITQENVQILKPALYDKYKADLARVCANNKISLLDLCKFDQYSKDDYRDTVHLNGFGGKKFVNNLVAAIGADNQLKTSLTTAGKGLANANF